MADERLNKRITRGQARDRTKNREMAKLSKPVRHEFEIADLYELDVVKNPEDMARLQEVYMRQEIQHKSLYPSVDAELDRYIHYTPFVLVQNVPQNGVQLLYFEVPLGMEDKLWKVAVSVAQEPPFKEEYVTRLTMKVDQIVVKPEYSGELIGSVQNPLEFPWMPKRYTAYHSMEIEGSFLQTDSPADVIFEVRAEMYIWRQKQSTKSTEQQTYQ